MIYAMRPFNNHVVCTKFKHGEKEVSVSCDDSCGAFQQLMRSDLRCYQNERDVTPEVFGPEFEVVRATVESFEIAWEWLRSK